MDSSKGERYLALNSDRYELFLVRVKAISLGAVLPKTGFKNCTAVFFATAAVDFLTITSCSSE
ncbi:MAG: hypothetical protein KME05_16695 [Gloeocapsa sp. UFS-A4-WI-NPMV-4B04]|jgi:hypothetical protein|nr:hypothetical protein [Gloeocapsa sp. UFS-A4-WI-NPMV-4B04]